MKTGPLAGTRVLDLIDGAAAYGPKLVAGLGADVIRVEPPDGSAQRRRQPLYEQVQDGQAGPSLHFLHYNAGKRGITLNLEVSEGQKVLQGLLDRVDIVFDNGQLDRLGFVPENLAQKSPPLVVVSVTAFGLRSTRTAWSAGDLICQAMSGMIGLFGYRDERPARFGPEQAFEMSGLASALGAAIALFGLRRTGQGEFVDIAIERVCTLVTFQMANASIYHQFGFQRGRRPMRETLHGVLYQARDGYVLFNAYREPERTLALLQEFGAAEDLPELRRRLSRAEFIADPRVEETVARFVAGRTRTELVELAQAQGIAGLPVNDVADLVADPFLQSRAFFVEVEHPELERTLGYTGAPVRFGVTPYRIGRRPPLLGEDNADVYAELGIDPDQLDTLRADGVV
ncbi:MAG: CaiB/BaiF CoA transferase family protein [Dehalococcoidia bacterium]